MKKRVIKTAFLAAVIAFAILLSACISESDLSAAEKLEKIILEFALDDIGTVYTDNADAMHCLSDEMLSSMFALGGNVTAFGHVKSRAAYFDKSFSGGEIIVFEMTDVSRTEEITSMFSRRAKRQENSLVICRGRYVYLICRENANVIVDYIKKSGL